MYYYSLWYRHSLYSMPVESGLQSALNRHTVQPFTESDDTRGCNYTICPPEDEKDTVRNMLRNKYNKYILLQNKGIVY